MLSALESLLEATDSSDWEPAAHRNRLGALRWLSKKSFWVICSS